MNIFLSYLSSIILLRSFMCELYDKFTYTTCSGCSFLMVCGKSFDQVTVSLTDVAQKIFSIISFFSQIRSKCLFITLNKIEKKNCWNINLTRKYKIYINVYMQSNGYVVDISFFAFQVTPCLWTGWSANYVANCRMFYRVFIHCLL